MAFIYVITNDVNGKQYVGKTNNSIEKRFQEHVLDSKRERCEKRPLYSAMNKYGVEHFHIEILEECSAEESANREIYWIDKLHTYGYTGYNATRGGDSKKYYDYSIIAQKYKELNHQKKTADFFGCDAGTVRVACHAAGVDILDAQEQARIHQSKRVAMYDKRQHDIVIKVFDSLASAATYLIQSEQTKCKHSTIRTHISEVCRGKRKSAAGYYWRFV